MPATFKGMTKKKFCNCNLKSVQLPHFRCNFEYYLIHIELPGCASFRNVGICVNHEASCIAVNKSALQ